MLITTIDELRCFVNVNISLNYKDVEPHLKRVELDIIRKAIGATQLAAFEASLQSSGSGSASSSASSGTTTFQEGLDLIRFAEANLALMMWSQTGSVQISSTGIHRVEASTEKGGKKSAFQYQEEGVKEAFKNAGYNYLNLALTFMDANLTVFSAFAASAEITQYRGGIIYNVSQFEDAYSIGGSYLVFARLKPLLSAAEDFEIAPAIGNTLTDKLRAEVLKQSNFDTKLQTLLPKIRKAIAHFAIADMMCQPGEITDQGLIFKGIEAVSSNMIKRSQASDAQTQMRINQARQFGRNYLQQVLGFLAANPTDYPDYTTHIGTGDNELNLESTNGKNFFV